MQYPQSQVQGLVRRLSSTPSEPSYSLISQTKQVDPFSALQPAVWKPLPVLGSPAFGFWPTFLGLGDAQGSRLVPSSHSFLVLPRVPLQAASLEAPLGLTFQAPQSVAAPIPSPSRQGQRGKAPLFVRACLRNCVLTHMRP